MNSLKIDTRVLYGLYPYRPGSRTCLLGRQVEHPSVLAYPVGVLRVMAPSLFASKMAARPPF